jgi:hypothetical protein
LKNLRSSFHSHLLPFTLTALFVARAALCHGQGRVVGQWDYRAGGFSPTHIIVASNGTTQTGAATRWTSRQGVTLEFLQEDWREEAGAEALLNTGGLEGYGLWPEFESASNKTVRAGIMLVKPEALHVRSVLLTGEKVVRLANRPRGGEHGHWDDMGPAEGVRIWVNQKPNAPLQTGEWQIVRFVLPDAIPLFNIVVAGDPSLPAWHRTLQGAIQHVLLLDGNGESVEPALRAMERVLAVRHQIPGIALSTEAERAAARAAKFYDYGQWGTVILVK